MTQNSTDDVCSSRLTDFHNWYYLPHGYASLVVCTFGSVANLLNIIVLTRREMSSPTNAILTGMAAADLLVMLEYIPYALTHFISKPGYKFTYSWGVFHFFHAVFTQVFHTISIWLTVTLAVWRYIAVAFPQKNREWCGIKRAILAIISGYLVCPVLCIPLYFAFGITSKIRLLDEFGNLASPNETNAYNTTLYFLNISEMGRANNMFLIKMNMWLYSVVIKIIPCIALTVLSLVLINALLDTKKRRVALTSGSRKTSRNAEKERQTDRTTRMLLAVLLLFLITEFPQGILGLLSGILGEQFFIRCYSQLGDVMDILALINSAINFAIYCAMSRQFRATFNLLFRPRWLPLPQIENGHNNHTTTVVTQV